MHSTLVIINKIKNSIVTAEATPQEPNKLESDQDTSSSGLLSPTSGAPLITKYICLECSRMSGVDATAAQGCFLTVKQLLREHGITLVFCGLGAHIERVLESNHIIDGRGISWW